MLVRRKIGWIKYDLRRTVTTEPTSLQRSSSTWWANHRIQHRTLVGGEEADSGFTFRINDAHSASWWTWLQLHFASLCRIIRQYVIFESLNLYISVTGGVVTQVSSIVVIHLPGVAVHHGGLSRLVGNTVVKAWTGLWLEAASFTIRHHPRWTHTARNARRGHLKNRYNV